MNPFEDFKFKNINEVIKLNFPEISFLGNDICVKSSL